MQDVNQLVCNYIYENWIKPWLQDGKKLAKFSKDHNLEGKVTRKICSPQGYRMPIETLNKICEARNISLSAFFVEVEEWQKNPKNK